MQWYPESEELMISLLDSSECEMKTICTALAKTSITLYEKCDKGKEKHGTCSFQVEWHQSRSKLFLNFDHQGMC